ncbi:hypothetical protein O181_124686 [Austropuccinia psidii MF-1]|uniref:Uncharacterized protein n=1 Tax=Austropuccinia psidii MF-1 TaxID=1389203 RepID=A0A9Q3KQX6_9BASI|nr:hypothetical protein [Austropuccinia psidii MF-1]
MALVSSSKPCKSRSGCVHDSGSESSKEYVQTQAPLGLNIPLTAAIASSMNVSGLKIDLGNPGAQTLSTWSIPNIVTPIPLNPTNTQMHVSEGPVRTPEISSKAYLQSKFSCEFLLDSGWNPVTSQDPFGENMAPKGKSVQSQEPIEDCDELYESSPLVHKEKVTGRHHPYASKPRTAHASSSRETMVDEKDEKMSLTQS